MQKKKQYRGMSVDCTVNQRTKPPNSNINTDMQRMWTIILQRAVAGRVLLTKGLNTAWLLTLESPGRGPVCWQDNLVMCNPDSSPGWGVIYPCVLASDNLPLIKGQSLSGRERARQAASQCETLASWPPHKWTFQTLQQAHLLHCSPHTT